MALRVDDVAIFVQLELTVAGVERLAAFFHLKEAPAADRDIQRVAGAADIALAELLRHGCDSCADTGGSVA